VCQGSTDLYVDISFGSLGVEDRHRCPETWPWHCESTSQTGSRKNTTEAVSSQMSPKSGPCWLTHQCTSKKVWFSYLLQQSVQKWDILLQQSYLLADALLSKLTWPRSLLWFTTTRIPTKLHQFLLCRQTHTGSGTRTHGQMVLKTIRVLHAVAGVHVVRLKDGL